MSAAHQKTGQELLERKIISGFLKFPFILPPQRLLSGSPYPKTPPISNPKPTWTDNTGDDEDDEGSDDASDSHLLSSLQRTSVDCLTEPAKQTL